jgi:hypothetical protein
MNPKKCSFPGCDLPRMKRPGNTTMFFKFCQQHQIEAVLSKIKAETIKDKAELDKVRQNGKKTAVERFYSSTAWRYCSRYVLLYYSDEDLNVRCATSPHLIYRVTDKEIHCGHYLKSDQHKATAFEFKNLFPQSYSDNRHFSGKPEIAKEWIERTHGPGTVEMLERKKNEVYKLDETELDRWAAFYKAKFNELLKQRGIKSPWK